MAAMVGGCDKKVFYRVPATILGRDHHNLELDVAARRAYMTRIIRSCMLTMALLAVWGRQRLDGSRPSDRVWTRTAEFLLALC